MRSAPLLSIDLSDSGENERVQSKLAETFHGRIEVVAGGGHGDRLPRVDVIPIEKLHSEPPSGCEVIAVGDSDLADLVDILAARPWINHVVSATSLQQGMWDSAVAGAIWRLLGRRYSVSPFFGTDFKGRQIRIRDSSKRRERVDRIADLAEEHGANTAVCDRIRDVAEELLSNALYDAPSERSGRKADRRTDVLLAPEEACTVTYGSARNTFFLRVRDQMGSLTRKRMFDVLQRCAHQSNVSLDSTRGGAGLGMWRIFSAASLLVVYVREGQFTEFIVGVEMTRSRRQTRARALHLFFENATAAQNSYEVQP